jgi:hypothetical protein
MQQGRGGMGSRKHGISGHPGQGPRLRLMKKLATERGEYGTTRVRRRNRLSFATVQEALQGGSNSQKPRRR